MLDLIRTKYFNEMYHLVKFVSSSNYTDGSYILPAFYQVWACFDTANADFWNEAITAGASSSTRQLARTASFPTSRSSTVGRAAAPVRTQSASS